MAKLMKQLITADLRACGITEYHKDRFAESDHLFLNSGRSILTKGSYRMQDLRVTDVVLKSLSKTYVVGNVNGKHTQEYKDKLLAYFKREADIWMRAREHPNIAGVQGFMESFGEDFFPALVFDFFPLGDLRSYVEDSGGDLTNKVRLELTRDVALGLKYLHDLQPPVVHRDLCGSNILLRQTQARIVACISDFGSAKLMDPTMNVVFTTTNRSSKEWQPPEYVKPKTSAESYTNPKPSGDIWSFGCVFIEVFTASDPWPVSYDALAELKRGNHPPQPKGMKLDQEYWRFLQGCWKLKPKSRPNIDKVIGTLNQFIGAER